MRFVKITLASLAFIIVFAIIAVVALFLSTAGDYPITATVADDAALPSIEIDGVQLHTESFGSPQNPTIIVLHGGPGADYRSLTGLQALSDDFQVVFYDQRGAGLSERVEADALSLDDYLGELDGMIDTYANGQPVTLIGHSWGAMLATAYLGVAPQKVGRVILMEPGYFNISEMDEWVARAATYSSGFDYLKSAVLTGFEAQHVEGPDDAASNDYLIGKMAHLFADHPENPYHCADQSYDAPSWRFGSDASQSAATMLADSVDKIEAGARLFEGPVLLLASACNSWLGEELQEDHLAMFSNGELAVIPDSGHDMVWDNPEQTLAAVNAFLSR